MFVKKKINLLILLIFLLIFSSANSQERVITLQQTISLAADSSIQALNARIIIYRDIGSTTPLRCIICQRLH